MVSIKCKPLNRITTQTFKECLHTDDKVQSRTINKLIRDFFSAQPPVYEESASEQKNIITNLKEKIKENKSLKMERDGSYGTYYGQKEMDKERLLSLEIPNPYESKSWIDCAWLVIAFEKENGRDKLYIKPKYGDKSYNFSGNAADLFNFVDHVLEQYREKKNRATKTQKIKQLKKGAVLAKIKEIAKNKQFNFSIKEFHNKLQLLIQISGTGFVTIDIFYSRFQQEMGKIAGIVDAVRELDSSGIVANLNFRSQKNARQLRSFIKYNDL